MSQVDKYLCLLDRAQIEGTELRFGEYTIRRFDYAQLGSMLRGCEDYSETPKERDKLGEYASCAWAVLEKAFEIPQGSNAALEQMLNKVDLGTQHNYCRCWYPFDVLVKTLNLLKRAQAPIRPVQFYKIPAAHGQSSDQIQKVLYDEPGFLKAAPGWKGYDDYDIIAEDERAYADLQKKLNDLKGSGQQDPPSCLEISMELFHVADRNFEVRTPELEDLTVLLLYDACIEALFIREDERDVENKLARRVPQALSSENSESNAVGFVRKLFFLRSKVAHGSRPVPELIDLIDSKSDQGIGERKNEGVPGRYSSLYVAPALQGFLANVRELARMSIRYFIDKFSSGINKDSTLAELDSGLLPEN